MINKLSPKTEYMPKNNSANTPSFKGIGEVACAVLQACDVYPMIGVAAVDGVTAIIPRTVIDAKTNGFAAAETFRRESSGLLVNCFLPSAFVFAAGTLINKLFYHNDFKGLNMASSWANEQSIKKLSSIYSKKEGTYEQKIKAYVKDTIYSMEGLDGNAAKGGFKSFSSIEDKFKLDKAISNISDLILAPDKNKKEAKKLMKEANKLIIEATGSEKTLRFSDTKELFHSGVSELTRDMVDMGKKFKHENVASNLSTFVKKATRFVNFKSLAGMGLILPLAASVQSINRWITSKSSGQKGAPIYNDFGKADTAKQMDKKEKSKFLGKKLLSAATMVGVGLISMMKKPSLAMFQFNGKFPTMDQCRWVSVVTFASRMLASEDKNELREATIRDIVTFASLYWVGDYVGKGIASIAQKINPNLKLLNNPNVLDKEAGFGKKVINWIKDVKLKTFDEAAKYGSKNKNVRALCQVGSLGFSMALLGIILPTYVRSHTEKNRKKELEQMHANERKATDISKLINSSTPLVFK